MIRIKLLNLCKIVTHLFLAHQWNICIKVDLGISFTGFMFNENNATDFYQYALSPFYNYTKGKVADVSISYTHYFEKSDYSSNASPIQNEFYGNILFKKSWLKPGIAAGYSAGKYHEIIKIDTVIKVLNQRVQIKYTDTASIKLSILFNCRKS